MTDKIEEGVKRIKLQLIAMQESIVSDLENGDINKVRADVKSLEIMKIYNGLGRLTNEE